MVLAGIGAGTINTIVGSGSLITFPTLLFLGYAPVPANISNNLAMLGGGITGTWGYRRELEGTAPLLRRLAPMSVLGGVSGALLLLWLPAGAFKAIVPVLIAFGLVLVVLGPRISAWSTRRHAELEGREPAWQAPALTGGTYLAGVYGGYFGAAQGVILVGLLSALGRGTLQTLNACKNVLAFLVNLVAGITFAMTAWDQIRWEAVALVGLGSLIGGFIGAGIGRRLPSSVLRSVIVLVGVVGIVKLVFVP
jgi:uncharacterized membrane protein YfcA